MAKEKLKKTSLTKEVKAAIVVSLLAVFLFGGIMILNNRNEGSQVVVNPNNNQGNIENPGDSNDTPQTPVVAEEKLLRPFNVDAKVERYFFDLNDPKTQESALLEYKGSYLPSTAMEYTYNNVKFDVVASFSGVVTERKVDPLYGYMVYIKNDDGFTAVYGSLNDVKVNVGDSVKQGDVIAKAGTNSIDALLNNHLHFALMKNEKLLNPNKYYSQTLKSIV